MTFQQELEVKIVSVFAPKKLLGKPRSPLLHLTEFLSQKSFHSHFYVRECGSGTPHF